MKHKEDGTCQLVINSPMKYVDSGRYICKAINSAGDDECLHYVRFQGKVEEDSSFGEYRRFQKMLKSRHVKPKDEDEWEQELYQSKRNEKKKDYDHRYKLTWITKPLDKVIARGSTLKLTAMVNGNYPQFEWYHDDVPLVHGRKYQFAVMNDGKGSLVIKNAQVEDSGKYKLVVKNYANSIDYTANVTIFEAPLHKFEPPLFTNTLTGNKSCQFLESSFKELFCIIKLYDFFKFILVLFPCLFLCRLSGILKRNVHHFLYT